MSRWSVLVGLLFAPAAWAGSFYLEAPAVADKADATTVAEVAQGQGQAARVVRRFRKGAGWEYVVVVEGFADAGGASGAAAKLAAKTGKPITVFETVGEEARALSVEAPPAVADEEESVEQIEASKLLDPAVKAHGGASGGLVVVESAQALKFEFRRVVPGGPTVRHVYAERGADRFLEVFVESGSGTASRSGIVGGAAWLAAGGASAKGQDAGQTAGELDRFAPEAVLAFPLGFAKAVAERREFQSLAPSGTETIDGKTFDVLKFEGGSAALTLLIDQGDHRVRKVTFGSEAGDVSHEYTDWKEIAPGLVVPRRVRTWRGSELIDDVEVLGIDLHPKLPDDWFRSPAP